MPETKLGLDQVRKPAPLWFRRLKKIWVNTENSVIIILLATGHGNESLTMVIFKTASSTILNNLDTLLGNGQYYSPSNETVENAKP